MAAVKQTPVLRARIVNKAVVFEQLDGKRWNALKTHLDGKQVEITMRLHRRKRSLNQNSYYWGVVVAMIAEEMGCTIDEAHDGLRMHFLSRHEDGKLPIVRSTTDLTTIEFEEYAENCRRLGAEMFGLYIPEPNEVELVA